MHKVTLCGPAADKRRLIARLQELGCLHVVNLGAPDAAEGRAGDQPTPADARRALRFLLDAPHVRGRPRPGDTRPFERVVRDVLALKARRRELKDRRDELRHQLDQLAAWGDFELPDDPDALGGYRLWFYAIPQRQADALRRLDHPWHLVRRTHKTWYAVVLGRERPPQDALPVAPIETDGRGTAGRRRELAEVQAALEDVELQRMALTGHVATLRRGMARAADAAQYRDALASAYDGDGLFALQAWAPAHRSERVRQAALDHGMAVRVAPPEPDELPPTLLDNPRWLQPGEDLAYFYQVPPARDWDPSGVVLTSFALFFAMILSDAGYGLVVLALTALPIAAWQGAGGQRLRRLVIALGGATVVFGVLAGSFFGWTPPPGSLPARAHLIELGDYDTAMKLSVAIGVAHIVLANAAQALAHWPARPALARLGWIAVALAGFAAWLAHTAGSRLGLEAALGVVAAGLLAVLAFRSGRPPRGLKQQLKRIAVGFLGVANVTKVFGDVLSYLRLFALGLATAMLAATFNDLAGQLQGTLGGLGVLAALVTVLVGHTLTFILAVVSGVVHGLRLEYIEFNAWALSGEGYRFAPLEKTEAAA
jgi:V/A-type H+-transporting ATPase subunit I